MSQDQRLQQVASILREKAVQFDKNKEKSKKQVTDGTKGLRDLINTVETDLLRKIDRIFEDNPFATALADAEGHITNNNSLVNYSKLEGVSREPVPPVTGSLEDDFFKAQKAILKLNNFERKARSKAVSLMTGRAASFDEIELLWGSVTGAVAYHVEGRKPSDSAFSKAYEGNSLSYTVARLEPVTRYLFRIRSVFGDDGTVSEWSEVIEVNTQEAPVPCNITASTVSCDTVNVSWSPVPTGGVSYRVRVVEATMNAPRSCDINCGQKTWYKPSGLQSNTKYSFSVQAGRGNAWGKWSSTVTVETPRWDCIWKECPDYVEENRKYSLSRTNPRVAANTGGEWCTIIGNTPLPANNVTSWSIKIRKTNNSGGIINIGVIPFDINQNEDENSENCGWYFNCYSSTLRSGPPHNYKNKVYGPRKKRGEYVHTGDSVGVVMDTAKGELSFVLNGVNLGVAFEGIPLDKPLVPCVHLGLRGDSVELDTTEIKETKPQQN